MLIAVSELYLNSYRSDEMIRFVTKVCQSIVIEIPYTEVKRQIDAEMYTLKHLIFFSGKFILPVHRWGVIQEVYLIMSAHNHIIWFLLDHLTPTCLTFSISDDR